MIAELDKQIEDLISSASSQSSSKTVLTAAYENLSRRAENFLSKLNIFREKIETIDIHSINIKSAKREIQHILDEVKVLKDIELKSIKSKGQSLVDEKSELKGEIDELIGKLTTAVISAEDDLVDFLYRLSDLSSAKDTHEGDMAKVRKLLENISDYMENIHTVDDPATVWMTQKICQGTF